MSGKTKVAKGVLVLAVGALPFLIGVGAAHADNENRQTQTFTFTSASTGQPVTCSVEAYAVVFGAADDPRRDAFASLKGFGDDPSCSEGTAFISATYRNNSGVDVRGGAGGERSAYWTADDVGPGTPNLVVQHQYVFSDCVSNCGLTITTTPK
jgi:hypothetical protein